MGFIAQDVKEVIPECVIESPNGDLYMSNTVLIPLMVKSIKELKERIEELEK